MRCIKCKTQFSTKGHLRCPNRKRNTCDFCYNMGQGDHFCDLTCENSRLPKIDYHPLSTAWAGFNPTGTQKCTTEEFMPRAYHYLIAREATFDTEVQDMRRLRTNIEFKIEGNPKIEKQIYTGESWKLTHLKDTLKEADISPSGTIWAPLAVLFMDPYLRVMPETLKLKINGASHEVVINDTPEMIALPDCYPPPNEGKNRYDGDRYSWYSGKSVVVYGPIKLGSSYKIELELEAMNFNYALGLLLPFRDVLLKGSRVTSPDKFPLVTPTLSFTGPVRSSQFPAKQEYNWTRGFGSRPALDLASAFRQDYFMGDPNSARLVLQRDFGGMVRLKDYSVIHQLFWCGLNQEYFPQQLVHSVEVTTSPIPVRIYEQLQKLPDYRDLLITFDVISFRKQAAKLELTSEIVDYTNPQIDNVEIPAYGGKESSRIRVSQTPKLKRGILKDMVMPETATLKYKIVIVEGTTRTLVEEGTKEVQLLANDQIIWSIKDARGTMTYDLGAMVGAWVHPDDELKRLDKIRGGARKFHPSGALEGGPSSLEDETSQVKALFDYLNSETGISYVNHSFKHGMSTDAQRILTPENVIDAESGNCIDLTLLFASLMEGLGINPLVLLTADHAFLGWGNKLKTKEIGLLECTVLGATDPNTGDKVTFEQAQQLAFETFKKEFLLIGSNDPLPFSLLNGNQIVDLSEARKKGIYRSI